MPGDTRALAELAARQHGVLSRAQLEALGVSGGAISRWTASARLHRIHPGVYALGHAAVPLHGRLIAALLYAGPCAALSHTTAAWVWSLIEAKPKRIHLTVPGRRRSLPGIRVHRTRRLVSTEHRALAVTTVPRTLVDIAAMLPGLELRRALAEANFRNLLDPSAIEAMLGQRRPGSRELRGALKSYLPSLALARSVLEQRFLELCASSGLPPPAANARIGRLMVDALWPDQRLVVELDGAAAHGDWASIQRDRRRDLALRASGYRVIRYTWEQVTARADEVVADLRQALAEDVRPPR